MNKPLLFVVCLCFIGAIWESTASAALLPFGVLNDEQTSIVSFPDTGEVAVDAPASTELTSINICRELGGQL